jgi:hypothetical protein
MDWLEILIKASATAIAIAFIIAIIADLVE